MSELDQTIDDTQRRTDRLARIRAMSDDQLQEHLKLLGDSQVLTNAAALPELEAELRRRGIAVEQPH